AYEAAQTRLATMHERTAALAHEVGMAKAAPGLATSPPALLASLSSLQALARPLPGAGTPWPDMGLDRGEMLAAAAQDAYRRALKDALLPRIAARLEDRLRAGSADDVTRLYEDLKAYLMLFGGRNFDATALRAFVLADWDAGPAAGSDSGPRQMLRR